MRSGTVAGNDQATAVQYNNLRSDAQAASRLLAHEQSSPNLTLYVEAGTVYFNDTSINYAGGSSPSFGTPSGNPRISLLVINKSGTLSIVAGTPAASPTTPDYPSDKMVLCEVYERTAQTTIRDTDTANQGYIQRDSRPAVQVYIEQRQHVGFNFETAARYLVGTAQAGSSVTFSDGSAGGAVNLSKGNTSTGYASLRMTMGGFTTYATFFDQDPEIFAFAQIPSAPTGTASVYIVCGNLNVAVDALTQRHFGFEIENHNGSARAVATWADGTTRGTAVVLEGVAILDGHRLYAKLYSARKIEFWIDGSLLRTTTTNLPSGPLSSALNIAGYAAIKGTEGTGTQELYLGPVEVTWKYKS